MRGTGQRALVTAPRLAVAGFLAACLTVVAGGQGGTVSTTTPLTTWFGLVSPTGYRPGHSWLAGLLLFVGSVTLVVLWLIALRLSAESTERQMWWIAVGWATPFAFGPPLISKDVYSYVAQGLMLRHGLNPYQSGVSALVNVHGDHAASLLSAVDPTWRSVPSPYGPVAMTIEHLAIASSGGNPLGAVIVLRILAVMCVVAIGRLAVELADTRRAQVLAMTVLNPLVLLHLVSGAHFEAPMCALLLGALVAARRRSWTLAIVLACAAGGVKAPAFLAVPAIIVMHSAGWRPARVPRLLIVRDVGVAALGVGAMTLLVHDGLGWVRGLDTPGLGYTPFAPASLIGDLFKPVIRSASFDDLNTAGRITTLLAALCIVAYLTFTARERPLNQTVGYGLLAVALLGPTIYPWYLLWGVLCLAPAAQGRRRDWLLAICGVAAVASNTGAPGAVTVVFDVIAVLVAAVLLWNRRHDWQGAAAIAVRLRLLQLRSRRVQGDL
ncbi:MAG: hypothetical protein DLM58_00705 [Pseudonocardiales bacterium]|nr:MAG: hypothetical protein DLM58_00705 [Pseudonocardiales bacterium]